MPVAATWSFPAMEISPCRHTGSVYNDNLVVAGHNYKTEFDVLFHLEAGDTVTFTDVDGNVFTYTVREFASVTPDDSDTVMNSGYALTMYTCNWDTSERVTVFCERTGGEIPGENG
jgi:sortase A